MESHIGAVLERIQDIKARLGLVDPAETPPSVASGGNGTPHTFDVALAQAGGNVQLSPLGGAGPFTPDIESLVTKYAAANHLSPEMVRAVIQQESGGNPRSLSAVGAKGLMQLMPETAQAFGVRDPFDAEQNIAAGTRYLSGLMREFNGDASKALAAYNAGSAAVRKYNGVPPFPETQQYVQKIIQMMGKQ